MNLAQLEAFVAVAGEGSFAAAAKTMHVDQSALSRQVAKLETELGVELFERRPRGVRVTGAGSYLLPRAQRMLVESDALERDMRGITAGLAGHLYGLVGAMTLGTDVVPVAIKEFAARHPGVTGVIEDCESERVVIERLLDGTADIAFYPVDSEDALPDAIARERIASEPLMAAVPAGHALAGRSQVPLADLRDERFIFRPAGTHTREVVCSAARTLGFTPNVVCDCLQLTSIRALVAGGIGITVVAASMAAPFGDDTALVEIAPPRLVRHTSVLWKRQANRSPVAHRFLGFARQRMPELFAERGLPAE